MNATKNKSPAQANLSSQTGTIITISNPDLQCKIELADDFIKCGNYKAAGKIIGEYIKWMDSHSEALLYEKRFAAAVDQLTEAAILSSMYESNKNFNSVVRKLNEYEIKEKRVANAEIETHYIDDMLEDLSVLGKLGHKRAQKIMAGLMYNRLMERAEAASENGFYGKSAELYELSAKTAEAGNLEKLSFVKSLYCAAKEHDNAARSNITAQEYNNDLIDHVARSNEISQILRRIKIYSSTGKDADAPKLIGKIDPKETLKVDEASLLVGLRRG
jgi:hypothetical protein